MPNIIYMSGIFYIVQYSGILYHHFIEVMCCEDAAMQCNDLTKENNMPHNSTTIQSIIPTKNLVFIWKEKNNNNDKTSNKYIKYCMHAKYPQFIIN